MPPIKNENILKVQFLAENIHFYDVVKRARIQSQKLVIAQFFFAINKSSYLFFRMDISTPKNYMHIIILGFYFLLGNNKGI